ncbi:MAG: circadian clock protein KaiB [Mucilaginibacter sp.]|nr:circadian clock protein KaiB [Mucilaginibacter sp.]
MAEQNNSLVFNANEQQVYALRLFVSGASPNSIRAITNLKTICETYLKNNYELEIIDIYQQPEKVAFEQIMAFPLLIKKSHGGQIRLIGDMSNKNRVLKCIGINPMNL